LGSLFVKSSSLKDEGDPASNVQLILLDLHIPKLDGWGFVREFRQEEWAKRIPVIAVSASATPPERDRALRAGCDDFLAKPYYPEQMRAMLEKHLPRTPAVR